MSKLSFALAALVAVPLLSTSAMADTKALAAAQKTLGGDANVMIGINVGSITSSKLFKDTVWPAMLAKGGSDMKDGMDLAIKECQIDPLKAISDVVVAMNKDTKKGVVYVGVNGGIDQAKLETCAAKIGAAKKKPVPTFKKIGNVIEVTPGEKGREKDKKYYTWVTADVIAMAPEGDQTSLKTWTTGKGPDAKGIGSLVAKTATSGAVWGVTTAKASPQPGVDLKGGYGSVGMASGNLTIDIHGIMNDAKTAAAKAAEFTKQLAGVKQQASKGGGGLPPGVVKMLDAVTITSKDTELVIKAALAEADVAMLFSMAMTMMH